MARTIGAQTTSVPAVHQRAHSMLNVNAAYRAEPTVPCVQLQRGRNLAENIVQMHTVLWDVNRDNLSRA
jgi:hypothetical protein